MSSNLCFLSYFSNIKTIELSHQNKKLDFLLFKLYKRLYYAIIEKNEIEEGGGRTREPEGFGPKPNAFDHFATSP